MNPSEKHILEIDSVELSFGDRVILSSVYLAVETLKALIRAEKRNKGILLTDHMYRHVTDVADRLYVLANGQTYLTQDAEDLVRYGYLNHL